MEKEQIVEKLEKQLSLEWNSTLGNPFAKLSNDNILRGFNNYMNGPTRYGVHIDGVNFSDNTNKSGVVGISDENGKVHFMPFSTFWEFK